MSAAAPTWQLTLSHQHWLAHGLERLIAFAQLAVLPRGGFAYQAADGSPMPDRSPALFLTCRLTHVAAMGVARGIPGSGHLVDHGVASLLGAHADPVHAGWFSDLGAGPDQRKQTYDHVHVGLAAASATAVGHPDGPELLRRVVEIIDTKLWREDEGALAESFAADWSDPEDYRGANANMHGTEAFLALGDVTEEARWHERALRMADRIINRAARSHDWLIPEHYDGRWQELPAYNQDDPHHPFRPYGATYGHALEWARFLLMLDASPYVEHPDWLLEAATALVRSALGGWAIDGREGLPYTVDWDGRTVVSDLRLHWPICEGIQACAALRTATGSDEFDAWYRRLWDHAAARYIDPSTGSWRNELADDLSEGGTVWPGRPDYYHSAGAYVVPSVPLSPFMTLALVRAVS